jgi:hypothetical protein
MPAAPPIVGAAQKLNIQREAQIQKRGFPRNNADLFFTVGQNDPGWKIEVFEEFAGRRNRSKPFAVPQKPIPVTISQPLRARLGHRFIKWNSISSLGENVVLAGRLVE